MLKVWITVKDNAGNVIYTNTNKNEKSNGFTGDNFHTGTSIYRLDFTGNCYNDSGQVFLNLNPTNGTIRLTYGIESDVKSNDCPDNYTPVLPLAPNSLLLTKKLIID